MLTKINANELCCCGSGQKFKRCCHDNNSGTIPIEENHQARWEAHADKILHDVDKGYEIKKIFFTLLELINGLKWRGACHFASPVLCGLFRGIGLDANVCTGIVATYEGCFNHSWVEVDDKVYDATIWLQTKVLPDNAPIIANRNLETGEETSLLYGIDWLPLEPDVSGLFEMPFSWVVNVMVNGDNAPLGMMVGDAFIKIIQRLNFLYGIHFDIPELFKKLVDMKYTYANRYPADSQIAGHTSSLLSGLLEGMWESDAVNTTGNNVKLVFCEDSVCRLEQGTETKSLYWHFTNNTILLSTSIEFAEDDIFAKMYDLSSDVEVSRICLKSDRFGLLYKPMDFF